MRVNPAMERWPKEAALLGNMLLAYGELELMVASCLGMAISDTQTAQRMMFRILGETNRIEAADAIMRRVYAAHGIDGEYGLVMGATRFCISLRNQYAHAHWADDVNGGLYFTDLNEPAKAATTFDFWYRHVDLPLLEAQAAHFEYAADGLGYLEEELGLRMKKTKFQIFPKPTARKPPLRHNPPEEHVPPFLNPEEQQRHIERALGQKPRDRSQQAQPSPGEAS